jgi:hypothetical protein
MAVVVGFQVRFYLRRFASRHWPTEAATIKRGHLGTVARGAYEYVFSVKGVQYSGRFIIIDSWEHAEKLQEALDGLPISIKYDPNNPRISLLTNLYDLRFDGKAATQIPYWFANANERDSFVRFWLSTSTKNEIRIKRNAVS